MITIADAAQRLADAGVASPRHDAEALAAHLLGVPAYELPRTDLGPGYDGLVARREAREPLQYIVGTAAFRRLELLVGPGAFVPRPETELVAGWLIEHLESLTEPVVVDLCAGPGTIALAVASEVPAARVHAVEADTAAADWARRNIAATGLPVVLCEAEVDAALHDLDGSVDAVVANPPYLVRELTLDPEVRDHEPDVALFAEGDGLGVIRRVVETASRLLRPGGLLAVEHADDQGAVVPALLTAVGFVDVEDHRDLAGRDRFATGRRPT